MVVDESHLQVEVAQYLKLQYPNVIFHSDYGSGGRLRPHQAVRQKQQNAGQRGWPDIFIAEPRGGYAGLFIELKREGVKLFKRNGDYITTHIAEQAEIIKQLLKRGYYANFAVGFEEAQNLIDSYLKQPPTQR